MGGSVSQVQGRTACSGDSSSYAGCKPFIHSKKSEKICGVPAFGEMVDVFAWCNGGV
jgi:hypothetical protein